MTAAAPSFGHVRLAIAKACERCDGQRSICDRCGRPHSGHDWPYARPPKCAPKGWVLCIGPRTRTSACPDCNGMGGETVLTSEYEARR